MDAFQVNLTNDNRTQKRRVDSVDGGDEALLAGEPPDPEANPVGDHKWRKKDSGPRPDDDHQNREEESILKRHRCERGRGFEKGRGEIGKYASMCHLDTHHT